MKSMIESIIKKSTIWGEVERNPSVKVHYVRFQL